MIIALGWVSLILIMIGGAVVSLGYWDMGRATIADAKMGGALVVFFGMFGLAPGLFLGLLWLILK